MRLEQINKPIKEYRTVATPRDEAHYREMMKTLHDLELKSARDPETMAEIKRRRMELRNWAEQNLKTEDEIPMDKPGGIGDYAHEKATGKLVRIVDYTDDDNGIYTISYGEGKGETDVVADDLEFVDPTVHQDLGQVGEGMIGKKIEYNDFLQNKLDQAIQEYDTPEKKAERDALMKKYLNKGGTIEKVPAGQKAFVGKKIKPAFKKDKDGTPITSPGSDESIKEKEGAYKGDHAKIMMAIQNLQQMIVNAKMGDDEKTSALTSLDQVQQDIATLYDDYQTALESPIEQDRDNPVAKPYVDMPEWKALHDMDDKIVQAYIKHKEIKEDAPFDGRGILQRAVFNKWISAEEWFHLKDEWKAASQELEQRYSDWPEGEGFGSSDHNFAIRDLMSIVGYEFDDQDTSGKFVVTKMPEKLEKKGITNVRMKGEPVATEAEQNEDTEATLLGKAEASLMHGLEMAQAVLKKDYGMAEVQAKVISENWPPLIDKIKNVYKTTEQNQDGLQPVDLKRLGQTEPKIYVHKDGKTIMIPKRKHNEYIAKGWKQSSLRTEASYESKLAEKLNQRLK